MPETTTPITPRPAGGWDTDSVPQEQGRPYWTFDGDAYEPTRWSGITSVRDRAEWFERNDTRAWQHTEQRASVADVRAAIAQQEGLS